MKNVLIAALIIGIMACSDYSGSKAGAASSDPLAVSVILDTSGSMEGNRLIEAKRGLKLFFQTNGPKIKSGLLVFKDCGVEEAVKLAAQDETALAKTLSSVDGVKASGATPIITSYRRAYDELKKTEASQKAILLVTDGLGNCADEENFCMLAKKYKQEGITTAVVGYLLEESAIPRFTCDGINIYFGINEKTPPDKYGKKLLRAIFGARRDFLSRVDKTYLKGVFDQVSNNDCFESKLGRGWTLMGESEALDLGKKKVRIADDAAFELTDPHPLQPGGIIKGKGKFEVGAEDLYKKVGGKEVLYVDEYLKAAAECKFKAAPKGGKDNMEKEFDMPME